MTAFDVIFVLPYLFSDHPSFPEGILKKALESEGFRVGVIETPFWQKKESFGVLGRPKLFFAVIAGPMDSVVRTIPPAGSAGRKTCIRPRGRPTLRGILRRSSTRSGLIGPPSSFRAGSKRSFMTCPSSSAESRPPFDVLRTMTSSRTRSGVPSFSIRAQAFSSTAWGRNSSRGIARHLRAGTPAGDLTLPGTAGVRSDFSPDDRFVELPPYEAVVKERAKLMESHLALQKAQQHGRGAAQRHADRWVVAAPPEQYGPSDLDRIHDHPYARRHLEGSLYSSALWMNLFSVTSHRGCGGGCAFCSIGAHQGKKIISRSMESIKKEIRAMTRHPEWNGMKPWIR